MGRADDPPQCRFNSRTREGCDLRDRQTWGNYPVSIHAPARGATYSFSGRQRARHGFNSRTREGCDHVMFTPIVATKVFQFTHPRGVRHIEDALEKCFDLFQFTHPRGVRLQQTNQAAAPAQFQFTHPRGVRPQVWGGGCGATSTDLFLRRYSNYPFCPVLLAPKFM